MSTQVRCTEEGLCSDSHTFKDLVEVPGATLYIEPCFLYVMCFMGQQCELAVLFVIKFATLWQWS